MGAGCAVGHGWMGTTSSRLKGIAVADSQGRPADVEAGQPWASLQNALRIQGEGTKSFSDGRILRTNRPLTDPYRLDT